MATNKKIFEAFYLRKNGLSYKEIAEKTGIPKSYLSFLFNNFDYDDIVTIYEKYNQEKESWWEQLSYTEIIILAFALIGFITILLKVIKWLGI